MSFDEMYDEMLHGEFSSRGQHQANAVETDHEPVQSYSRGRHAAAERPRGFQRYRTAGLVGAGGLACAAAGALLGGLGGYFSISPAAAHQVSAATVTQDLPLAQAVTNAAHSTTSGAKGTSAVEAASFSKVSGSLTQGIAPFATLTSLPLQNLPVTGIPGLYNGSGGTGNGTGGGVVDSGTVDGTTTPVHTPAGCTSSNDLGLTCMLASLPGALSSLGSVGDPGGLLNSLPQLGGLVTDLQGLGLTQLLPIASLPVPSGGVVPTTLLAGTNHGSASSSPVNVGGVLGGTSSNPVVSALAPVLNTVGSVTGGLGSTTPSLPVPLPTSGSTTPGLPVGIPSSPLPLPLPSLPVVNAPSSGSSTTINVPVPVPVPLPLPTTQPISIGGLTVGISSSGSTSGLTLTLP